MAKIKCRVCGSNDTNFQFPYDDRHNIYSCNFCGCDILTPQPTNTELAKATDNEYFSYFADEEVSRSKVASFLLAVKNTGVKLTGKILEIGAGKAFVTKYLRSKKFQAWGIERENNIWKSIGSSIKRYVFLDDFEAKEWKGKFDLLVMFDLIEHLRDPLQTMNKANSILNNHGKVLIVTPNLDSWKRSILKRNWSAYYLEHNFIFRPKAMEVLANQSGFRMEKVMKFHKIVTWKYFFRALNHRYPNLLFRILASLDMKFEFQIDDDSMLVLLTKYE